MSEEKILRCVDVLFLMRKSELAVFGALARLARVYLVMECTGDRQAGLG